MAQQCRGTLFSLPIIPNISGLLTQIRGACAASLDDIDDNTLNHFLRSFCNFVRYCPAHQRMEQYFRDHIQAEAHLLTTFVEKNKIQWFCQDIVNRLRAGQRFEEEIQARIIDFFGILLEAVHHAENSEVRQIDGGRRDSVGCCR